MASDSNDNEEQLSFSEWCDRKFTNMYSHDDFVTSIRPRRHFSDGARQTQDSHQDLIHERRMPSWKATRGRTSSRGMEMWPGFSQRTGKVEAGSTHPKSLDTCDTTAESVSNNASGTGRRTKMASVGSTQEEVKKISQGHQEDNLKQACSTEDTLTKSDIKNGCRPSDSVYSASSGQENHTTKRTHSQFSPPDRKHPKSRKCSKKRVEAPGSSPRGSLVHQPVVEKCVRTSQKENTVESSHDVGCVRDRTKNVKVVAVKDDRSIADEESLRTSSGKTTSERSLSGKVHRSSKSKKTKAHKQLQLEQAVQISSGEFDVESSVDSDSTKGHMLEESVQEQVGGKEKQIPQIPQVASKAEASVRTHKEQARNKTSPTCDGSRHSRSRLQGRDEKQENWGNEKTALGQDPVPENSENVQHGTSVGIKNRNVSETLNKHKDLRARRTERLSSGEYDVEHSGDSDVSKPDIEARKPSIRERVSQSALKAESSVKTSTEDTTNKPKPNHSASTTSKEKKHKPKKKHKHVEASASASHKELPRHGNEQQSHHDTHLKMQRSLENTSHQLSPKEEKIHVKSVSTARKFSPTDTRDLKSESTRKDGDLHPSKNTKKEETNLSVKCELQSALKSESTRKDSEFHPSKNTKKEETNFFVKRELQSALKPEAPRKAAGYHPQPKSAWEASSSVHTNTSQHRKPKSSRSTAKVRLEHIYKAFDSDASSPSEEESGMPVRKSQDQIKNEPSEAKDCQLSHPQQSQCKTKKQTVQAQFRSLSFLNTYSETTTPRWQFESSTKTAALDSNTVKPEAASKFKANFVPLSTFKQKQNASDADSPLDASCKTSKDVASHSLLHSSPEKSNYVREWLEGTQEQSLPGPNCNELPPSSASAVKKTAKVLEPGEVSDDSSESDGAWEQLVANITKENNEVIISSSLSKSLEQHHAESTNFVLPLQTSSFHADVNFKPRFHPRQKNVATVSPYCVTPSPPPLMSSTSSIWSRPTVPDTVYEGSPLESYTASFSPIPNPPNADLDLRDGFSLVNSTGMRGFIKPAAVPSEVQRSSPGEYPGNRDGFQSFTVSKASTIPVLGSTPKARPVRDIPPRFLRLAQLKAKGQDAIPNRSVGSACIYSGGIRCEDSMSMSQSTPDVPPLMGTPEAPCRSWIRGSLSWPSSLSRTPGTITPTRFTPFTNQSTTPSPWKTYQRAPAASVELSPIVDYPASTVPYIDTHCHIDFLYQRLEFCGTFEKFSKVQSFPDNYAGCVAVFCTPEAFKEGAIWESLAKEKNIWMAFGCHPHHAKSYDGVVEENIIRCMKHPKAIALGEIGLDYSNRCTSDRPLQLQVFRRQLHIALLMGKPLVIHSRDAEHDTLSIMTEMVPRYYKIHRHCFTGSPQEARNFFRAFPNAFIGLTALVTFPTAYPVHRTASEIPLNKILLETDAPYFLPKQCPRTMRWANPSMAVFVADRIAQLRGLPLDEVLNAVRRNTTEMYGI